MRRLLSLLPWMVLAVTAYGQVRPADVLYTHYDTAPTRGYRVGEEVFVPVEDVSRWDWQVNQKSELAYIKAEGVEFNVATRVFNGRVTIPLVASIKKAGGQTAWDRNSDTLSVYSELTAIRVQDGRIKISSPFKVMPRLFVDKEQQKLVVELAGSRLSPRTQQVLENAAVSQVQPNVVRMVIQTDRLPDLAQYRPSPSHTFEMDLPLKQPDIKIEPPVQDTGTGTTEPPPTTNDTFPPITNTFSQILPLKLEKETDRGISMSIPLPVKLSGAAQARKPEPHILEVTLPGIAMVLGEDFKLESQSITDLSRSYDGTGTVLRFTFSRPMAAEIFTEGNTVRISVIKPLVTGTLIGKVIVVDPGHGGPDSGAKSGGAMEKHLNLAIGKLIAQRLTEEGATVIMTRKTDVFITLNNRAKLANDSDADLFISTHINSTGGSGSQSGTIVFHHKQEQVSKLLAECIFKELAIVNGMPDIGVWSDQRIYNSGFAVLRQTKMPGVLLEMGFINHSKDRARMVTKEFQEAAAAAVVKGIKVFLGNAE